MIRKLASGGYLVALKGSASANARELPFKRAVEAHLAFAAGPSGWVRWAILPVLAFSYGALLLECRKRALQPG